jgi:hypothetical protein
MTSEERNAWQFGILAIVTYSVYVAIILQRAASAPLTEVDFGGPMIWTILGSIIASIVLSILLAIVFPRHIQKPDVRDRQIGRFGEYVGHGFVIAGALAAMLMAIADWDRFWIANVIYLGFTLSAVLSSVAKIVAYRRGFQPW